MEKIIHASNSKTKSDNTDNNDNGYIDVNDRNVVCIYTRKCEKTSSTYNYDYHCYHYFVYQQYL